MVRIPASITIAVALLMLGSGSAQAEEPVIGFLSTPFGVRATGMGNAFVALADAATAVTWNPAGLVGQRGFKLAAGYWGNGSHRHPCDAWNVAGIASVPTFGTLGFYGAFIQQDFMIETQARQFTPDTPGEEWVAGSACGLDLDRGLSVGMGLKVAQGRLWEHYPYSKPIDSTTVLAADFGFLICGLLHKSLSLGATLTNVGPDARTMETYTRVSRYEPLPLTLRFGAAHRLVEGGPVTVTVASDLARQMVVYDGSEIPFFESFVWNTGAECWIESTVAFRMGFWRDQINNESPFTFGASLRVLHVRFDFAYVSEGKGLYGEGWQSALALDP